MLIKIKDGRSIKVSSELIRYFPALNFAFDLGKVTKADYGMVEVCFGDTVREYCMAEIAYAINTVTGEEHFMTIESGNELQSLRSNPLNIDTRNNDAVLDSFEEMLKTI